VWASRRPKAVAEPQKIGLVDGVQRLRQRALDDLAKALSARTLTMRNWSKSMARRPTVRRVATALPNAPGS
jgi:hypothetical protein